MCGIKQNEERFRLTGICKGPAVERAWHAGKQKLADKAGLSNHTRVLSFSLCDETIMDDYSH